MGGKINPDTDLLDLHGKVAIVTGGKYVSDYVTVAITGANVQLSPAPVLGTGQQLT